MIKLLWLAIRDIEDKRARNEPPNAAAGSCRKADGRLVEGQVTTGWNAALGGLAIAYPDRINYLINENRPRLTQKS